MYLKKILPFKKNPLRVYYKNKSPSVFVYMPLDDELKQVAPANTNEENEKYIDIYNLSEYDDVYFVINRGKKIDVLFKGDVPYILWASIPNHDNDVFILQVFNITKQKNDNLIFNRKLDNIFYCKISIYDEYLFYNKKTYTFISLLSFENLMLESLQTTKIKKGEVNSKEIINPIDVQVKNSSFNSTIASEDLTSSLNIKPIKTTIQSTVIKTNLK